MWDAQERDGRCEVGTGQGPCKSDDDDNYDDDILCLFDCTWCTSHEVFRTPYLLTHATSPFLLKIFLLKNNL